MRVFVDTSALYALLDRDDANHEAARETWARLLADPGGADLVTHKYVLVEVLALVQRRLGVSAARVLVGDLLPVVRVVWVDEDVHARAVAALCAAGHHDVSLVDQVSFAVMSDLGLDHAFAFDEDFTRVGFRLLPAGSQPGTVHETTRASEPAARQRR